MKEIAVSTQRTPSKDPRIQRKKYFTVRLSEQSGDIGRGTLEVYKPDVKLWVPACVNHWDQSSSPATVCTMLGYSSVNSSKVTMRSTKVPMAPMNDTPAMWRMYQTKQSNLLKEFNSCDLKTNYPVVDLTCSNYGLDFHLSKTLPF